MFEYFPNNYAWSLATSASIAMGAELSEIDEALRPLVPLAGRPGPEANEAWYRNWMTLAQKLERLAAADEAAGNGFSAGAKHKRAANYFLFAERIASWADPRRAHAYDEALTAFAAGVELSGDRARRIEVDYEGGKLAGWLRLPEREGPFPAVMFYNGFDSIKEMHYLMMGEIAAKRGIAVLYVDQEGTGEAVRRHRLPKRAETEVSAGLFVDALAAQPEIDAERIGIVGLSMGGYCAPRAAAFEPRLKAAVSFGAFYGIDGGWERALRGGGESESGLSDGLPESGLHAMHVTCTDTVDAAVAVLKSLSLEGVLDRIRVPFLVVHGENDRQVTLDHARRTIAGTVNSPDAELKGFSIADGSCEHVGIDVMSMHGEYVFDWLARQLGGRRA